MRKHCDGAKLMIVGTKTDLVSQRQISNRSLQEMADKHGGIVVEVSSKTGQNIDESFNTAAAIVLGEIASPSTTSTNTSN